MSPAESSSPQLDAPQEAQEVLHYQALSGMAVVAFLLGIGSFLALFHFALWSVPVLGIAASLAALRGTTVEGVTGRKLAVLGLILSLFFGAVTVSRHLVGEALLVRQARAAADAWLELVRVGRLREAYQWSIGAHRRVPQDELVDAYFEEHPDMERGCNRYFAKPGLRELAAWGKTAQVAMQSSRGETIDRTTRQFDFHYVVSRADQQLPLTIRVTRRWLFDEQQLEWNVSLVDEPSTTNLP